MAAEREDPVQAALRASSKLEAQREAGRALARRTMRREIVRHLQEAAASGEPFIDGSFLLSVERLRFVKHEHAVEALNELMGKASSSPASTGISTGSLRNDDT